MELLYILYIYAIALHCVIFSHRRLLFLDLYIPHNVPPPWPILRVGIAGRIHAFGQLSYFSKAMMLIYPR